MQSIKFGISCEMLGEFIRGELAKGEGLPQETCSKGCQLLPIRAHARKKGESGNVCAGRKKNRSEINVPF